MSKFDEIGVFGKPWKNRVRVALVYPNTYSVGMSSLGFQTIYRLLNEKSFITCDRVFLPEKQGEIPLSVENAKRLSEFDFVLFSVSYSTDFINIAGILKNSSITLDADLRKQYKGPILGAGGTAVCINPEPLSPILDFFLLGEGEYFIEEFAQIVDSLPGIVDNRNEFLARVREIEGIYIPEDLSVTYLNDGSVERFDWKNNSGGVMRTYVPRIDDFPTYSILFSPQAAFGRIFMEEISRGCARGCRFCAIGFVGRPFRTRKLSSLKITGLKPANKIGVLGAAISDHPQIKDIARLALNIDEGLSFSSFRVDKIDKDIVEILKKANVKTFTMAPEAGSERLRRIINKAISDEEIINAVRHLNDAGIKTLKLYFMIGLPYENNGDIIALTGLGLRIAEAFKGKNIMISLNPFVPKPFTPFQWHPLASTDYLKDAIAGIKKMLSGRKIRVQGTSIHEALIDALFSKGDRRLGERVIEIVSKGEELKKNLLGLAADPACFIYRNISPSQKLPWDFIDNRVDKELLAGEFEKAEIEASKIA